jgi:hypothetical protein
MVQREIRQCEAPPTDAVGLGEGLAAVILCPCLLACRLWSRLAGT